jgi:hypothetical protein
MPTRKQNALCAPRETQPKKKGLVRSRRFLLMPPIVSSPPRRAHLYNCNATFLQHHQKGFSILVARCFIYKITFDAHIGHFLIENQQFECQNSQII